MAPEIRLLKKMAPAGAVVVPLLTTVTTALAGSRIGLSVAVGGILAVGVLAMTALGAALFARAGDRAVPVSYAAGFFVKLGLLTAVMFGLAGVEAVSLTAVALSMGTVYLALLGVGVAFSDRAALDLDRSSTEAAESG